MDWQCFGEPIENCSMWKFWWREKKGRGSGPNAGFEFGWQFLCSEFYECPELSVWSKIFSWGVQGHIVRTLSWVQGKRPWKPMPIMVSNKEKLVFWYFFHVANHVLLTINSQTLSTIKLLKIRIWYKCITTLPKLK